MIAGTVTIRGFRGHVARALVPALRITGFRFSKDYRWGTTLLHKAVYACVDTVLANVLAEQAGYDRAFSRAVAEEIDSMGG